MKLNLNQRTKEWYSHRKNYINASEIASVVNCNPFRSLYQLINDKNRFINKTQTNIQKTYFELLNLLNDKINQFLTENDKQELIQLIKDKITNFGSFNAKEWFASWFKKGDS